MIRFHFAHQQVPTRRFEIFFTILEIALGKSNINIVIWRYDRRSAQEPKWPYFARPASVISTTIESSTKRFVYFTHGTSDSKPGRNVDTVPDANDIRQQCNGIDQVHEIPPPESLEEGRRTNWRPFEPFQSYRQRRQRKRSRRRTVRKTHLWRHTNPFPYECGKRKADWICCANRVMHDK